MGVLKLKSGDDLKIKFTITDSSGAAVPLTGGTIRLKIARNLNVSDANAEYFDSFTSFTDPTNGIHIETIPKATTAAWTPGDYQYQSRFVDTDPLVRSEDVDTCEIEENLIDDE